MRFARHRRRRGLQARAVTRVAGGRVADLEEDPEGRDPDSRGWQVGTPYRTVPPAALDCVDEDAVDVDEVWLDAAALRARIAAPAT